MSTTVAIRITRGASHPARWWAVALGFSLPLSVALDNLLLAALLAFWLVSGQIRAVPRIIAGSPVVACAIGLIAVHAIGLLYTIAPRDTALSGLWNGARLLFLIVLIPCFMDARTRERALTGFAAAMALTLCISLLVGAGALAPAVWHKGTVENPVAFKYHITHNLLMSLTAFLFALRAVTATSTRPRWFFGAAAILAAFNVLFMVAGRTGHVV